MNVHHADHLLYSEEAIVLGNVEMASTNPIWYAQVRYIITVHIIMYLQTFTNFVNDASFVNYTSNQSN